MRQSERRNNLRICPRRNSNTGGSDLWSSTLPLDHGGALTVFIEQSASFVGKSFTSPNVSGRQSAPDNRKTAGRSSRFRTRTNPLPIGIRPLTAPPPTLTRSRMTSLLLGVLSVIVAGSLTTTSTDSGRRVTLTESQKDDVRHAIETVVRCRQIPGITLSVVTSDVVLWKTTFGVADVERNKPVTTDTLFPIGSTTKAFTSTLLAMLLEKYSNRINWDTPIVNILGNDFKLYNKTLTDNISLRDLLSHRTGVPGYFLPLLAGLPENVTRKELVRRLRYFEPTHQIRTTFQYNNYMFMLAGYVAEVLENEEWEHLNAEMLFKPLGMTSTIYVRDINEETDMAEAYTLSEGRLTKINRTTLHQVDVAGPAGAIVSTATDMIHWLQFNLRGGRAPSGESLIAASRLKETYSEQMAAPSPMSDRDLKRPKYPISDIHAAYDLGWMTNYYRGYKRVWHSGGITTYKTMVWLYPDVDVGIFLSTNGPPSSNGSWGLILALYYLSDVLLNEDRWLNGSTLCDFPQPWASPSPEYRFQWPDGRVAGDRSDYLGTYRHPGYCDIVVADDPDGEAFMIRMGRFLEAELLYNETSETFYTRFVGELWYISEPVPVKFARSQPGGRIEELRIPFYTPYDTAKPIVFAKYSSTPLNVSTTSSDEAMTDAGSHLTWLVAGNLLVLGFSSLSACPVV
ncbi:hypothetical protein LSH36_134g03016 [Paralvinella palmiformis]|uniref:Beta-lactamase-related domain-containing protein n=1 Tax=Paralvinella palmiformis TaxID=53620 RepID=A0AAD9JWN4_9ANNE|nr:hypothetical protein LSH36_134g03016 [Paralvinella palmiformis]